LDSIDGSRQVLAWSLGSSFVLLKETLFEFLIPRSGSGFSVPEWNPKDKAMRKLTLGICGVSLFTVLLLLLAPTFRQALDVSVSGWRRAFDQPAISPARMQRLAQEARRERDAEFMAFAAMHLPPGKESLDLADEAVKLNPDLTWIYMALAQKMDPGPVSEVLIGRVVKWDPDNAAPRLALADALRGFPKQVNLVMNPQADLPGPWLQGMAAAFAAPKYDTYLAEHMDLERSVMRRRKVDEPMLVMDALYSHGIPNMLLLRGYARHLLIASQKEEAAGQIDQAWQSCWAVARFGQLIHLQAHTNFERLAGASLQLDALEQLQVLAEKQKNGEARALIATQSEQLRLLQRAIMTGPESSWMTSYRSANVSQNASVGMLISLGLLACASLIWLLRRALPRATPRQPDRILSLASAAGAGGLTASSLTIYLCYQPFAEVFSRFMARRGADGAEALYAFVGFSDFSIPFLYGGRYQFPWYLLLAAATVLMLVELRRVIGSAAKPSLVK
jgi:hypothetical protein